jgi:hypothetical protein
MNGPLFNPPQGGGMDGADAQTMAAVRSVCSLHLFNSEELDFVSTSLKLESDAEAGMMGTREE